MGIGFIVAIACVVAGVIWWLGQRPQPLDSATLCPVSGPLGHQVLLVDRTDPFNPAQKAAFDNLTKDMVENLPVGYMFSVLYRSCPVTGESGPIVLDPIGVPIA